MIAAQLKVGSTFSFVNSNRLYEVKSNDGSVVTYESPKGKIYQMPATHNVRTSAKAVSKAKKSSKKTLKLKKATQAPSEASSLVERVERLENNVETIVKSVKVLEELLKKLA